MASDMPMGFDVDFYRSAHPDLSGMSEEEARWHYLLHGVNEGRQASPVGAREGIIAEISASGALLEIGPFCNPLLRGQNVRYCDALSADQLRERAAALGLDPIGCPATIDFVGGLSGVEQRFDVVLSSHSVEHQPDLVQHLKEVEATLAHGGRYVLIVPDKRYCFDHYLPESTIIDVIAAWAERRRRHTLKAVVEHGAFHTHNDPARHWKGDHGEPRRPSRHADVETAIRRYFTSGNAYIDVHAWYFTPQSFYDIVSELNEMGLTSLKPQVVYPTVRNTLEFVAVLGLG